MKLRKFDTTTNNKEVAYVMVNCEVGSEELVIEKLKTIQGIKEVQGLSGNYDIVMKIEVESIEMLREMIVFEIRKIPQIHTTTTLICTPDVNLNYEKEVNLTKKPIFEFICTLENKKHILLLYDDQDYAKQIEFEFLKKGLEKEQHCIYATEEDPGYIMLKMINYGIPIDYFKRKNLIRVFQMPSPFGGDCGGLEGCKNNIATILAESKPPFRIVARAVPDVSTHEGMSTELELEQDFHSTFDDFGGSIICPYDITKIEPSSRKKWIAGLLRNHHNLLYVSKSEKSGVFNLAN